jgi:hypothetical protein
MYLSLQVKCRLSNFHENCLLGAELFHAEGRTDSRPTGMTKLTVAFRSVAISPRNLQTFKWVVDLCGRPKIQPAVPFPNRKSPYCYQGPSNRIFRVWNGGNLLAYCVCKQYYVAGAVRPNAVVFSTYNALIMNSVSCSVACSVLHLT